VPPAAPHQQVGVPGVLEQHLGRLALDAPLLHRRGGVGPERVRDGGGQGQLGAGGPVGDRAVDEAVAAGRCPARTARSEPPVSRAWRAGGRRPGDRRARPPPGATSPGAPAARPGRPKGRRGRGRCRPTSAAREASPAQSKSPATHPSWATGTSRPMTACTACPLSLAYPDAQRSASSEAVGPSTPTTMRPTGSWPGVGGSRVPPGRCRTAFGPSDAAPGRPDRDPWASGLGPFVLRTGPSTAGHGTSGPPPAVWPGRR